MSEQITDTEIELSFELNDIAEDIKGVREVQEIYGNMPSSNYKIFLMVDRDSIDYLEQQLPILKSKLKPVDEGKNQIAMVVNNAESNRIVYMATEMKNIVIDSFKATLPQLDDQLEEAFSAKKAELEATQE